jgi:hypothetical protein
MVGSPGDDLRANRERKTMSETDDSIRRRIAASKATRTNSNGHNRAVLDMMLKRMKRHPGKIFPISDLEVFIESEGGKYSSAGPATSYGVRIGVLKRTSRGHYQEVIPG